MHVRTHSLTGIAIYSVQLLRDRHNEDPSTTPDRDIPAPDPELPSKQVNHASANRFETSISPWVLEALFPFLFPKISCSRLLVILKERKLFIYM